MVMDGLFLIKSSIALRRVTESFTVSVDNNASSFPTSFPTTIYRPKRNEWYVLGFNQNFSFLNPA